MARVDVPVQEIPFEEGIDDLTTSGTAADATNDHSVVNSGSEFLVIENLGASPCNVTCVSVADTYGRTGDATAAVPAGGIGILGPFAKTRFNQSGGVMNIDLDFDTTVTLAWLRPARKRA